MLYRMVKQHVRASYQYQFGLACEGGGEIDEREDVCVEERQQVARDNAEEIVDLAFGRHRKVSSAHGNRCVDHHWLAPREQADRSTGLFCFQVAEHDVGLENDDVRSRDALERAAWRQWRQVDIVQRKTLAIGIVDIVAYWPHRFQLAAELEIIGEDLNAFVPDRYVLESNFFTPYLLSFAPLDALW